MHRPALNPVPTSFVYEPPREPWIDIVHEDSRIVVVNKPSGLLSVPGKDPRLLDSLQVRAGARWAGSSMIHRLDKDTSGLLVLALDKRAHAFIAMQFEKRTAEKTYIARVWGDMEGEEGLVDLPLATDWENKPRQQVDHQRGRPSRTLWRVIAREGGATRLELRPLTGRTHQLRVHMLALGHPILGDPFYATGDALDAADRLQLHAESLSFVHPDSRDPCAFKVEAPF